MARRYNWARYDVFLGDAYYLTGNKWYKIVRRWDRSYHSVNCGYTFVIKDNIGKEINCLEKSCAHIMDNNWELSKSVTKPS